MNENIKIDQYGRVVLPFMKEEIRAEWRNSGIGFYDPQAHKHLAEPWSEEKIAEIKKFAKDKNRKFEAKNTYGLSVHKPKALVNFFYAQRYALSWREGIEYPLQLPNAYKNQVHHKELHNKMMRELPNWVKAGVFYATQARRAFLADSDQIESQIIALAATYYLGAYSAVLVCSRTKVRSWQKRAANFLPYLDVVNLGKAKTLKPGNDETLYILAYEDLEKGTQCLARKKYHAIIVDHADFIKNPDTSRTEYVRALANKRNIAYRFLLTNFPMNISPKDLLEPLKILDVLDRFEDLKTFMQTSPANPTLRNRSFFHDMDYQRNLEKLDQRLRVVGMLRRESFPGLRIVKKIIAVKVSANLPKELRGIKDVNHLLRKLAFRKAHDVVVKLKNIQERHPNKKAVVFVHYVDVANYFAKALGAHLINSENRSKTKNLKAIEAFRTQKGGSTLIIGNKVDEKGWDGEIGQVDMVYITDLNITPKDYQKIAQKLVNSKNQQSLTIAFLVSDHWRDRNAWAVLQERIKQVEIVLDSKPA